MNEASRPLVCLLHAPSTPDPYAETLEAAGFQCKNQPVLAFDFINQEALALALHDADAYAGLILTSPRAVEALALINEAHPDSLTHWRTKPAYVVGRRTAEGARALGLQPVGATSGVAEHLAGRIVAEAHEAPLLFLSGNRRRDVLPDRLSDAGVPLREVCVYATQLRDPLPLSSGEDIAWLVFFSPSGVEAMQRASKIDVRRIRRAALGPTTAEALVAAGWPPDAVAEEPTPEALAAAIRDAAGQTR